MNAKQTALDTYLARTIAIHTKLERSRQLVDDHFGHDPDAIHWGDIGDLGRAEAGPDELLAIFGGNCECRRLSTTGDRPDRPSQTHRHADRPAQGRRRPT